MPENEFEKQVQQKMDGLRFVPADTVWKKVEKQISGRKKRRLLWLPFLFLFAGGMAWLYYGGSDTKAGKEHRAGEVITPAVGENNKQAGSARGKVPGKKESEQADYDGINKKENKKDEKKYLMTAAENNKNDNMAASKNTRQNKNYLPDPDTAGIAPAQNKSNSIIHIIGFRNNNRYPAIVPRMRKVFSASNKMSDDKLPPETVSDERLITGNTPPKMENETNRIPALPLAKDTSNTIVPDSMSFKKTMATKQLVTDSGKTGSIAVKTKKPGTRATKKIEWGFSMNAGVSNITDGLSGLFATTRDNPSLAYSSPQNNPGSNINGNGSILPSGTKPDVAFGAGIVMRMQVGKNVRVAAALRYSYNSTRMEVGTRIDSNNAAVQYRTGNGTHYTNRFHFIELPVTIEKQLGTASRFSIYGGMAVSVLAGSNALQYNEQKDIYYTDNSRINKVQTGLLGGFQYRLLQNSLRLEIGPRINYDLSHIFKNNADAGNHLFFAGIHTTLYFGKNKQ